MITAIIPVALMEQANAYLESLGFGPRNFSVAMKASGDMATHAGVCCWPDAAFKAALDAMLASGNFPGLTLGNDFNEQARQQALEWTDPTNWTVKPVMKGDQRAYGGKTWESLLDYNVWAPPVGWREVVQSGYPAWVQPTGAHDAYPLNFIVSHKGKNWRSGYAANVWEPGVFGWTVQP